MSMSSRIFITLITFGAEQAWWNCQLYCFLHISVLDAVTIQYALFDSTTNILKFLGTQGAP